MVLAELLCMNSALTDVALRHNRLGASPFLSRIICHRSGFPDAAHRLCPW
jgi:hypothetical protein